MGFIAVIVGLAFFLVGLERALFPLGKLMAVQLTDPEFILGPLSAVEHVLQWHEYKWVYIFAFTLGFSTTLAEPSLLSGAQLWGWRSRLQHFGHSYSQR